MSNAQRFLITYGLHHFVTHSQTSANHAFFIRGAENEKMVRHARNLITEMFGEPADIQIV